MLSMKIGSVDFELPNLEKELYRAGVLWRKNARISLRKHGRYNTGALYKGIDIVVKQDDKAMYVELLIDSDYWQYIDLGVRGAKKSPFPDQMKSPFSYKKKMPPSGPLDRWVVKKGLEGTRDKKGRFVSRQSMVFLIRRAIYTRGIKPTRFITGTGERIENNKKLHLRIAEAYAKDVADNIAKQWQ